MSVPGHRREKFFPEEDERLKFLVEIYGTHSWDVIAAGLPGRNVRQCRDRWKHYLSGTTANEPWTPDDDRLLFRKMQEFGPKWTTLSAFFPGRTDTQVKNRWMQQFATVSTLHLQNRSKQSPANNEQPIIQHQPEPPRPAAFPLPPISEIADRAGVPTRTLVPRRILP
jgi:hypothetical protein